MTNEELFDAYRQVVSERDQLRQAGDVMWGVLRSDGFNFYLDDVLDRDAICEPWEALRGIGAEPSIEEFKCG